MSIIIIINVEVMGHKATICVQWTSCLVIDDLMYVLTQIPNVYRLWYNINFYQAKAVLNSVISSIWTGCLNKSREPSSLHYFLFFWREINGYMPFPRALAQSKSHIVCPRFEVHFSTTITVTLTTLPYMNESNRIYKYTKKAEFRRNWFKGDRSCFSRIRHLFILEKSYKYVVKRKAKVFLSDQLITSE